MQQVNRAYDVLSDPMKRKLYDRYGLEALELYENKTITEDAWNLLFMFATQRFTAFIGCLCVFIFTLALLSPIFIGLRLDDTIEWSWFLSTFPLYVLEFIGFLFVLVIVSLGLYFREEDNSETDIEEAFLHENKKKKITLKEILAILPKISIILLLILFQVLLCAQLDGIINWNWWFIFSPLILMELVFIAIQLPDVSYSQYQLRQTGELPFVQFYCHLSYIGFILHFYYTEILFLCCTLLFTMNLQYAPETSEGNYFFLLLLIY